MMSTNGLPATRSLPKEETWNWAHMFRSDVALECFVFQSFAAALMPSFASLSALVYCALPSFSTRWR